MRHGFEFLAGNGRRALVVLFALSIGACARPVPQTFDLVGAAGPLRAARGGGPLLSVREPTAVPPTSSDRIVVRVADGGVYILPGAQWSAGLPRLLQERMIESLQRAGVAAARINPGGNRALWTNIERFEIDAARNVAVVEFSTRITDETTGAQRAAQVFSAEAPAPDHTGAAAAFALAEAAREALGKAAAWARAKL